MKDAHHGFIQKGRCVIAINSPLQPETTISRYMSFAKFAELVRTGHLFFNALDRFEDRYEGTSTALNRFFETGGGQALSNFVNGSLAGLLGTRRRTFDEEEDAKRCEAAALLASQQMETVFGTFHVADDAAHAKVLSKQSAWLDVSCWHQGVDESLAMWKIYGGSAEAVCIQSTVGRLAHSLKLQAPWKGLIARVNYVDHHEEVVFVDHLLGAATSKAKAYEYEKEIRAIVWRSDTNIEAPRASAGSPVPVSLAELITKFTSRRKLQTGSNIWCGRPWTAWGAWWRDQSSTGRRSGEWSEGAPASCASGLSA